MSASVRWLKQNWLIESTGEWGTASLTARFRLAAQIKRLEAPVYHFREGSAVPNHDNKASGRNCGVPPRTTSGVLRRSCA